MAVDESSFFFGNEEVRIEITVFITVFNEQIYNALNYCSPLCIVLKFKEIRNALYPFCNIGIPIQVGLVRIALAPLTFKGREAVGVGKSVVHRFNGSISQHFLLFLPKSTGNLYV